MEEHRVVGHDATKIMWGKVVKCFMALMSFKFVVCMEIHKIFLTSRMLWSDGAIWWPSQKHGSFSQTIMEISNFGYAVSNHIKTNPKWIVKPNVKCK